MNDATAAAVIIVAGLAAVVLMFWLDGRKR